jgi:DNA-binding protein YbaB
VKVAVTVGGVVEIKTVQVDPEVESHPLQLVKLEPMAGAAVRVTLLPEANSALQTNPQSIPLGLDVTVPLPFPAGVTVRANVGVKVTVTVRGAVEIKTVQVDPEVESHPLQPVKVEPGMGLAVRVTLVL